MNRYTTVIESLLSTTVREHGLSLPDFQRWVERVLITTALQAANGHKTNGAKLLGLKRTTFLLKLQSHGLTQPRKKGRYES